MINQALQPLVLKPKFQSKPRRKEANELALDPDVPSNSSHHHVGIIDQGEVVIEEATSVVALQSSGSYGRIFPEFAARRRKGKVCVTDAVVPMASELLKLRCEDDDQKLDGDVLDLPENGSGSPEKYVSSAEDVEGDAGVLERDAGVDPPRILKLHLEEALYLMHEVGSLMIFKDSDGKIPFTVQEFSAYCLSQRRNFLHLYLAYRYYRRKGWVVKDGETFGVHFVLYKSSPSEYHSSYGIVLTTPDKMVTWRQLSGLCRSIGIVSKELILCVVDCYVRDQEAVTLSDLDKYRIKEMHVKTWFARHQYSSTSPEKIQCDQQEGDQS